MDLCEVGNPKPRFAVKRNSAGSSGSVSDCCVCDLCIGINPGIKGPRLLGTASYSGKSSSNRGGNEGEDGIDPTIVDELNFVR